MGDANKSNVTEIDAKSKSKPRGRFVPEGYSTRLNALMDIIRYCPQLLKTGEFLMLLFHAERVLPYGKASDLSSLRQMTSGIRRNNPADSLTTAAPDWVRGAAGTSKSGSASANLSLEKLGLIKRTSNSKASGARTYTRYKIQWAKLREFIAKNFPKPAVTPVQILDSPPVQKQDSPCPNFGPLQSSFLQSALVQKQNDLDCPPTNCKPGNSRADVSSSPSSRCKQFPKLAQLLARYMKEPTEKQPSYLPSDRQVVDILEAAGGATEKEVCGVIAHLYNVRGLRPDTSNGPRTYEWFKVVIREHFDKQRAQQDAARPSGYDAWSGANETKALREQREYDARAVSSFGGDPAEEAEPQPEDLGEQNLEHLLKQRRG